VKFQPNVPITIATPAVVVDAGLPAGTHRFQLVVVNSRGQRSAPATVDVIIEKPTVILNPIPTGGAILPPIQP